MAEKSTTNFKVKEFRADQVFYWLYTQQVGSFSEMHNIGRETRKILEENFWISSLEKAEKQKSQDGSIKYRLLLDDGLSIESVFMPHTSHNTVCVSSQVGCGMGCDFCMTGTMGLVRNLKTAEIIFHNFSGFPANIVHFGKALSLFLIEPIKYLICPEFLHLTVFYGFFSHPRT